MFKRLAKSRLAYFGLAAFGLGGLRTRQRIAPRGAGFFHDTPFNDNLPGLRRPKGQRRIPSPALACHWINRNGRLECRWQVEPDGDSPIGGFDEHAMMDRASGLWPLQPRGRSRALAG